MLSLAVKLGHTLLPTGWRDDFGRLKAFWLWHESARARMGSRKVGIYRLYSIRPTTGPATARKRSVLSAINQISPSHLRQKGSRCRRLVFTGHRNGATDERKWFLLAKKFLDTSHLFRQRDTSLELAKMKLYNKLLKCHKTIC